MTSRLGSIMKAMFKHKPATIRAKVMGFTTVLLMGLVLGYGAVIYVTHDLSRNFDALFAQSQQLYNLEAHMNEFEVQLDAYLQTKDSDSFIEYMNQRDALKGIQAQLRIGNTSTEDPLALSNIAALINHYVANAETAIRYKRARNTEEMLDAFAQVHKISSYLRESMTQLQDRQFSSNLNRYDELSVRMNHLKELLLWIFLVMLALGGVFVYDFIKSVSHPIERLSHIAQRMTVKTTENPLLSQEPVIDKLDDLFETDFAYVEASVLSNAFEELSQSLGQYIEALKDKAITETQLRLSAVENLKMQNLLKQAELLALQAQINPHFLFNTINAGLQLAILEDADQTAAFLDHMARMFRYNIQRLDNTVTLADEIGNIMHYYHLMKVRFQDMVHLEVNIPKDAMDVAMPPMVLQPIVENALVHGFRHQETQGVINIVAKIEDKCVALSITDNGQGMTEQDYMRFMAHLSQGQLKGASKSNNGFSSGNQGGHTTGLGISNVYERLKVFYEQPHVMDVTTQPGLGTTVTLYLRIEQKEADDYREFT